jgi:mRNA-degrading endonuclease RelE of RelBE toxin-antitoxin system
MTYELFISEEAREQLRALPGEQRRSIGQRLHQLQQQFTGDIKKLEGQRSRYRLRVGTYKFCFG